MKHLLLTTSAFVVALTTSRVADAQIAIQQPVVSTFSVSTTVSVPDSGAGFLGGLKSAGESRFRHGPFRSGTNSGVFRQSSAASTRATIHDFAAMDDLLLRSGSGKSNGPALSGYAKHAFSSLTNRRRAARPDSLGDRRLLTLRTPKANSATIMAKPVKRNRVNLKADRSYKLGLQAIKRGKTGLAKLHFKTAAKLGSTQATQQLALLDGNASKSQVVTND